MRILSKLPLLPLLCAGILACAAHPEPIIDTKGVNMAQYEQDLADCTQYSEAVRMEEGMAKGAAAGAVAGAAAGAIGGNVGKGAGYGAVAGTARSGVRAADDKADVVKRCLRYRGYRVLN